MPIELIEIISESHQGFQRPYLCTADDEYRYYVKGRQTNRASLFAEWICAKLGAAFGLPIPIFQQIHVSQPLIDEAPKGFKDLGVGIAFGSRQHEQAAWLELSMVPMVPVAIQRDVLVFDWWVHNTDRHKGNSNLLWDSVDGGLVVIDHNLAFDPDFEPATFLAGHIFADQWAVLRDDLVMQAEYSSRLSLAMAAYDDACEMIPEDWRWENPEWDIPAKFDVARTELFLNRCKTPELWRME